MYSTRLGPVTSLLGGTNIYAANGGQRTILTNAQEQYVYPLSNDGFGNNGVTTGRYMSFSLFLAGVPDDVAGIVSAVYMVPIPPVSTTGSTLSYAADIGSNGIAKVNDKQCCAMGALYNDGQGIGYVTEEGYFANAGRTEIDLMETSKDSCQTTHHGFYGSYYTGMSEKGDQNLPSRLGNTQEAARGSGGFVNYIRQETMPGSTDPTVTPPLGDASTGLNYDFDSIDGCIDPNGLWNNPFTVSAINGIDYFNEKWGYGVGKFIDTSSPKGVQYDYYIKPELATAADKPPTTSNLTDYWSGVDDPDTATWYTLKIYYRIVQEQSDGTVNVLPNQDYYKALDAVDNSQVDKFIKNSEDAEEAGDGYWFLVDSSPDKDFADAYGLPRAPCFYSGYDLKYMILTQSYWTPSLIGQAGAGPTIWLDGNEDPSLTGTDDEKKCKPTDTGGSRCSSPNVHDVDCAICRGPNVSTVAGTTCTSIQQTELSNYYRAQQVQNFVACQGAPNDPKPGNMTIYDPPAPSIPNPTENCCGDLNLDGLDSQGAAGATAASDGNSYYNIFYNLYMDVYLSEPHWTLDYQYRGVNTTKTAPALYDAKSTNANAWRGGYGPQFGICNIDSGWPSDSIARGVDIVNILTSGDAAEIELCPDFLTSISSNLNPTNQPQTLADLTDRYGKSQTDVVGGALSGGDGVPEWYQSVCFPEEGSPKLLWISKGNGQYAMKIGCNFLPTELQTKLP